MNQPNNTVFSSKDLSAHCSSCSMHEVCLPNGLEENDMEKFDVIVGRRRKVLRDSILYRVGDPFTNLYAIRLGHFKTHQLHLNGGDQVTGFHMAGELLGMDAIASARHQCDAVALEDCEVCEIPFNKLESLFNEIPVLLRHFHRTMSREITREQSVMLLLGNMRSEQRFAAFLVNLSSRYVARGYSAKQFQLRMSREDIGNYLGLTIESISRLISKFKARRLITVQNRDVNLIDLITLKAVAAGTIP
jgi:CRP/FNR family transcriptional regulator